MSRFLVKKMISTLIRKFESEVQWHFDFIPIDDFPLVRRCKYIRIVELRGHLLLMIRQINIRAHRRISNHLTYPDGTINVELDQSDLNVLSIQRCPLICSYKRTTIYAHSANIERQFADSTIQLILHRDVKARSS